jgi:Fe(3+) dicitrate transport protein
MKLKKIVLASTLALVFSVDLFGQEVYTIKDKTLREALEIISKKSTLSYIASDKLLESKKKYNLENVEGLEKALKKILEGSGLKAVIKDDAIVIIEKETKNNTNKNSDLGEFEVQGSWLGDATAEDVKVYSGARTVINSEYLQNIAAKNIEDALRTVPGIQIQDETGTGVLPNISLRGLKPGRSANLNALVNGIPAAIAPYSHSSFSLFPITMETLERIDVVRGGAAVHYGPNNVGGVVNFITKPISTEHSSTVKSTVHIAENGNVLNDTYARTGGFVNDKLGLQFQYNGIKGESYRDHSDTDVKNLIFDLEYFPSDNSEIKSTFQYYTADADLPGALLPNAYDKDRSASQRPYDRFEGKTSRASVTYKVNPSESTEFYWMNYAQKSNRKFAWGWNTAGLNFTPGKENAVSSADREINVIGTEPRWTFEKSNHKVTFGARYILEDVDYLSDRTPFNTGLTTVRRDWKIKTNALASYVSDTMSFMGGDLKVTPGLRYEKIHTDFGDNLSTDPLKDKQKDMNSLLPGLSIGYQANEEVFLFTNAQRSLKAPQVAQVRADGDLTVELAWNYEAGIRYEPNDVFSVNSTLYRIDYKDQIEYVSSTQSFNNLGKTRHQGLETQFILKPNNQSSFTLGYAFLDTEQLSGTNKGKKLPWVASHQVSLSSDYKLGNNKFNLTGIYLSKTFSDSANTKEESANGHVGENPGYMTWNTKISREVSIANDLKANLSFGVNNLLDEDYYFRGVDVSPTGRVPGQGRSYIVSCQIDF